MLKVRHVDIITGHGESIIIEMRIKQSGNGSCANILRQTFTNRRNFNNSLVTKSIETRLTTSNKYLFEKIPLDNKKRYKKRQ